MATGEGYQNFRGVSLSNAATQLYKDAEILAEQGKILYAARVTNVRLDAEVVDTDPFTQVTVKGWVAKKVPVGYPVFRLNEKANKTEIPFKDILMVLEPATCVSASRSRKFYYFEQMSEPL